MKFHIYIDIKQALDEWSDKQLTTVFTGENGKSISVHEIRADLYEKLEAGETKFTAGNCNNKHPDGSCAGHDKIEPTGQLTLDDIEGDDS